MSLTYSDVDASADPLTAVEWQERMTGWPAVRAYKERTYDLLASCDPVLDVGCGPGSDVVASGFDRCFGVDASSTMCAAAAARGAVVSRADAHALPFRTASLGGVRADRVFQHLSAPEDALRELARVVARGGRIVVADPDQESLVIQVPDVRSSVLDRLKALRRDAGYRNGRLISRLPGLLERVDVADINVDAFPLVITHPADAFGLPTWPSRWREEGGFTDEELAEWDGAMRAPTRPGFLYVVTFLVVSGTRT